MAAIRFQPFNAVLAFLKRIKRLCAPGINWRPDKHLEESKAYGLKAQLYHIYTLGDYIFLDIAYENGTKLSYAIDELRFNVDDKKVTKASTVQSLVP